MEDTGTAADGAMNDAPEPPASAELRRDTFPGSTLREAAKASAAMGPPISAGRRPRSAVEPAGSSSFHSYRR